MYKPSKKIIQRFTLPSLVVLILLLIILLILPIRNDILDLRQSITDERIKLEKHYLSGQSLKNTYTQLNNIEPDLFRVEAVILEPGDELMLITTLEDLADKHDLFQELIIDDLVFDPEADEDEVTRLPTRVDLTGRLTDVLVYLVDVESLDFYVNWQTIDINKVNQQSGRGIVLPNLAPDGAPVPELGDDIIRVTLDGETFWRQ